MSEQNMGFIGRRKKRKLSWGKKPIAISLREKVPQENKS